MQKPPTQSVAVTSINEHRLIMDHQSDPQSELLVFAKALSAINAELESLKSIDDVPKAEVRLAIGVSEMLLRWAVLKLRSDTIVLN